VGKWLTASVIQLIHKKSSRSTMRTTKCGLIKRFSPAAYLMREQGSNRYSRLQAYYKGFDPKLTYYKYLNQKLWKSLSKFNTPGSSALTYPSKVLMSV
jgi:hypothetical protein